MPRGRNFFDEVLGATNAGDVVYFYLPLPPQVTHARPDTEGWSEMLTEERRAYRRKVAEVVAMDFARSSPFENDVEVRILLRFAGNRSIDINNQIKPLLDALTHAGVWKEDRQVHSVSIVRELFDGDEHCVVEVAECSAIARGINAIAELMHGDGVLDEYLTGPKGAGSGGV